MFKEVGISIGSNQGNRAFYILSGIQAIKQFIEIENISSLYLTKPWGYKSQNWFLNGVLVGRTSLSPQQLIDKLLELERKFKRERCYPYSGPRTLDLDILFYENFIIETKQLSIPHPLLHLRAFVLIPLNEIYSKWIHPKFKKHPESFVRPEFYKQVRKVISRSAIRFGNAKN